MREKLYLSPPHMSGRELDLIAEAFDSNWIAPLGPHVEAFEREFADRIGSRAAVALSSGTAAVHLSLRLAGVAEGDEVLVSTLTFVGSVNPVLYLGARPVFVDSEASSWNMDPALLEEALRDRARLGRLPAAVMVVHLYGQSADLDPIAELCQRYEVPLIEDAAEALGATYRGRSVGTRGESAVFSFNGNKIITTSGGGMLVSDDEELIERARKLSAAARDPAPHYQHSEMGYNYRLSNILAAVGRAQLGVLEDRVTAKRALFDAYHAALSDVPGVEFMPEASWGRHTRWLTTLTVDPDLLGMEAGDVVRMLQAEDIEARPVWKPMHMQPLFDGSGCVGGGRVAEDLFANGLCLPSGTAMTDADVDRVVAAFRKHAPLHGQTTG